MEKKLSEEQLKAYHGKIMARNELKIEIANTYMFILQQEERMKHMTFKAMEMDGELEKMNEALVEEFGPISQIDMSTGIITNKEEV